MLIRNMFGFLPAQLLSPAAQLLSMVLWTHWLTPAQLGVFTLVSATQEIAYTVSLSWFSTYALRYVPADTDRAATQRFLGAENWVVMGSLVAALVAGLVTALTLPADGMLLRDALIVGLYFASRGINAHYAERARAQSSFLAYTLLQTVGPVGAIGFGLLAFQYFDAGPFVLLAAYVAAQVLGALLGIPLMRMSWRLPSPDWAQLRAAVAFGGPVLGLGVLGWVAENYIRYLVQWQAGAAALGLMIVGWSLGRRCAAVATMLVATAAFPLAARLLNDGRRAEALQQLSVNAAMVLAVLAPVTAALVFLGPALVALTVAQEYRQITAELLGWAVFGGALRNLHVHVSDQLMVLDRRLAMLARLDVVEIVACVGASLLGLQMGGLKGALVGQALGSMLALGVSMRWARLHLGLVWPWGHSLRVLLATATMSAGLWWLATAPTLRGLVLGSLVGAGVYGSALALMFASQTALLVRQGWSALQR
jgi:O-antigen/teichoic acid export membrane protein